MVKAFHLHNSGKEVGFLVDQVHSDQYCSIFADTNILNYQGLRAQDTALKCGIKYARHRTSSLVLRGHLDNPVETEILRKGQRLDPAQRRRSPRIRLQVPVFLRGADTSGVEFIELTKTVNISAMGACIASLRPTFCAQTRSFI